MNREPTSCRHNKRSSTAGLTPLMTLSLMFAAGCATYGQSAEEVAAAMETWQRHQYAASSEAGTTPMIVGTPAPTTTAPTAAGHRVPPHQPLKAYVREALERNPCVATAVANLEATLARVPQATALPDPFIRNIIRPEPIQTAAGDMYYTLGVGQRIPFPAKLDRAGKVAAAEVRMAIEQLNAVRLRVIGDVERAWYSVYLMDRHLEVAQANVAVLEDLARVVVARYEVGKVTQADVLRVQTELADLRNDLEIYRLRRSTAAAALNQLRDYGPAREIPHTQVVDPTPIAVETDVLIRLAETHNPELARLARQRERDEERLALADLGYWPDLTVGIEWTYTDPREPFKPPINPETGKRMAYNRQSEGGDDNWAFTIQFDVPLWIQKVEAARREARMKLLATDHELRGTRNLVAFRIFDDWARAQAKQETLRLLDTVLIPQARQTYEISLTGYQAGDTTFLTVIDNWQRWLQFEQMRHQNLTELETAFSQLQQEVGLELIRAPETPTSSAREDAP